MICTYPTCRQVAIFTPVVEIPTIRTVGVNKPVLPTIITDVKRLKEAGFNQSQLINQHVAAMDDYISCCNEIVKTDKPTYLICREVCQSHRDTYRLQDWFLPSDWRLMQEAAHSKGFHLEDSSIITVTFRPIGWLPQQTIELERDRMKPSE